jgi:D-alanyl-lipoteichoic acid acyltransferase DltB (MBOAT superfamily)
MRTAETPEPLVFNSFNFVAFFLVVYALYRLLAHRGQNWLLLAASYYFYAAWDWRFLGLLVGSTVVDYLCALYIARRQEPGRRKTALIVSLAFHLTVLGFFKYFNFFADSLKALLQTAGLQADYATLHIVLPIGISFYTFITMSYLIDVYRREIEPCRDLRDFALFVAYFPYMVAGPIVRAGWMLPQIVNPRRVRADQVRDGLWLIVWGFFKKVFVADNLAHVADAVFSNTGHVSGLEVLLGVYAFAFQIYGDFSGYSDIARGTSQLMGIELPVNFRFPYFVRSAPDFWRHWHISLSTWLRDYLYISLGGNRHGETRTKRNLALTMVLGGLWHGAAWTYVVWGAYQGALLIAFRTGATWLSTRPQAWLERPWARAAGVVLMFQLTCYGWLIFRANSVAQIGDLTASLAGAYGYRSAVAASYAWQLLFFAGPLLVLHAFEAWRDDLKVVLTLRPALRYAICAVLLYMIALWGEFGSAEFIYARF